LLALGGCATIESVFAPPAAVPQAAPAPGPAEPQQISSVVVIPKPTTPQELAAGFIDAMARGNLDQARAYYLSDEEFDALFGWATADPRPERKTAVTTALQAAAPLLAGAQFQGLAEPPTDNPTQLQPGTNLPGLVLEQPVAVLDAVTAVVDAGGLRRAVRLEGLVRLDGYWRLFSPTLAVR